MSFYISLFIFIISVIAGLALMIAGKEMRRDKFLLLASIHLILLFAFIASLLLKKNNSILVYNYFFTAFICSGVMLSGLAWRNNSPIALRIYFSVFALTIPLFMFSPSMLLNFLLTMDYSSSNGKVFHLDEQYYLESQSNSRLQDTFPHYKVILKKGIYHQTVLRDLEFGGTLDSLKVIKIEKGKSMLLRGFTGKNTFVTSQVDSIDTLIFLNIKKPGDVEYHL